jgi:hypothetical protein
MDHCGSCVTTCPMPTNGSGVCTGGECSIDCDSGYSDCDGTRCLDTQNESTNCGSCGHECDAPANGHRELQRRQVRFQLPHGLREVRHRLHRHSNEPRELRRLRHGVRRRRSLLRGKCTSTCPGTQENCDGACVDTSKDPAHCGSCTTACPGMANATPTCTAGCAGSTAIAASSSAMARAWISTPTSITAWIATPCALRCRTARPRARRWVAASLQQRIRDCSGRCVNLQGDVANCGMCGRACTGADVCANGQCTTGCPAGTDPCG